MKRLGAYRSRGQRRFNAHALDSGPTPKRLATSLPPAHEEIHWSDVLQTPPILLAGSRGDARAGALQSLSYGEGFSELAPYVTGDAPKHIHWASWVDRGALVSRRYDQPQQAALCLLVDETGSMATGAQWRMSRQISARLAAGALAAGHLVRIIVERDGGLRSSQWLRRSEDLIWWWGRLFVDSPQGLGASRSERNRVLGELSADLCMVCISDGVCVVEREDATDQLITCVDQLSGALGRLRYCLYLCLVDPYAEQPPHSEALSSSEVPRSPTRHVHDESTRAEAAHRLHMHRVAQKQALARYQRVTWLEAFTHDTLSDHLNALTKLLSRTPP